MAEMNFRQKIFKTLYGWGMKKFGADLLDDLKKGSPAWMEFVEGLLEHNDYATRKVALKQLLNKNFLSKSKNRDQCIGLGMEFLTNKHSIADEKKAVLKFVDANLDVFPAEDDAFRSKILALQRETDSSISNLVAQILPKIGINMDDRELYRRN